MIFFHIRIDFGRALSAVSVCVCVCVCVSVHTSPLMAADILNDFVRFC